MSDTKRWVRVTIAENIPLREGRSVQLGGHDIAIFNLGDRFLAIENRCPHRGGPLADGIVSTGVVVCPLHAWKIDLTTGSVTNRTDDLQCVRTFPARVENGVVSVELNVVEDRPQSGCFASMATDASLGQII